MVYVAGCCEYFMASLVSSIINFRGANRIIVEAGRQCTQATPVLYMQVVGFTVLSELSTLFSSYLAYDER